MGLFSGLGKILKVAAPVAGLALGGPLGAAAGGALSGLIGGSQKAGQGDKNRSQADQIAMQRYQSLAPLRQKALAMAQSGFGGQRPSLAAGFAGRGNPYERPQMVRPGQAPPMPPGLGGPMGQTPERPSPLPMGMGGPQIGPGNPNAPGGGLGSLRALLAARQQPMRGTGMGGVRPFAGLEPVLGGQDMRRQELA
jgi:hypothetical protein